MMMQIMIKFAPKSDMAFKTIQRFSIPNWNVFGPSKAELWAKEVGEFSIVIWENGLVSGLLPANMAARI